ncbi:MAG: hypothetical protein A4S09_01835 [Proteobacteria bacterium SG_bin7]|nr:MAG: hypothetical protein A4S09_01835 [Proteobacteria bacterium SG_bin7]
MRLATIFSVMALLLSGCTHSLHVNHVSDFSPYTSYQGGKLVKSSAAQFVILDFVTQTDYVEEAYQKLMQQCSGYIKGITTQYSTSHGFLSWTNKIQMQGICVQ